MRASTRKGYRQIIESDLEIMPLMNLFVAMIPMLLISAVFLNVTVIDMRAPAEANAAESHKNLALTVTLHDDRFVVDGRGLETRVVARGGDEASDELAAVLSDIVARHPNNRDVIIASYPQTKYNDIVAVMDICRDAGLPSASLLGAE